MIQVLLVDDHPSVTEGTRVMLEQKGDITVTIVHSGIQTQEILKVQLFDILLIDLNMPGITGVELVNAVLNIDPEAIILIYTGYDIEPHFNLLVEAGISGFVPKTASTGKLVNAIRSAFNGDTLIPTSLFRELRRGGVGSSVVKGPMNVSFNDKDLTILIKLAQGKSNKEIAAELITSQRTLEYSITQIFQKLNVKSRKEAVSKAKQIGIVTSDDFF
ncbi:response regulator transcription factor [Paenibacillus frigoriresistens]|uniref:response regulator transcription factor n=1 Tax=Paenibacillus alginolyticus TaxID=59839 RepID=UPI00156713B5|nr:response regulator transcription factor [Paenibacillus frigoriresistens]NRF95588.1 response regulator transcription factor [Paenibacillus frigoriresistens]